MNIEKIDKWLDNEYGVSYTRLEELHDFVVEQDLKHREEKDKEIDRLKNIINRIDNFVDRTIEVIKHQPSDNDEWILERLNGIKHLIELKENK